MSTATEQQPWTLAAHSLSYDEVSLMDMRVSDVEKLVKEACLTHAAALTRENERLRADLNEAAKRDGNWQDKFGACKVCDGDIPHGHAHNCDIYKLEQQIVTARREIERLRAGLDIIAAKFTDESNGPGRADWFQAIAREALNPTKNKP